MLGLACVESPYTAGKTPSPSTGAEGTPPARTEPTIVKPEFVRVTDTAAGADAVVRAAVASASGDARKLVVYVGATWCEPCKRFHEAVERGELDARLAGVRFLEFDSDEHGPALDAAGYGGRLIPRFVRPGDDGRATDQRFEGGIKGDGAVANIMQRLDQLLDG